MGTTLAVGRYLPLVYKALLIPTAEPATHEHTNGSHEDVIDELQGMLKQIAPRQVAPAPKHKVERGHCRNVSIFSVVHNASQN